VGETGQTLEFDRDCDFLLCFEDTGGCGWTSEPYEHGAIDDRLGEACPKCGVGLFLGENYSGHRYYRPTDDKMEEVREHRRAASEATAAMYRAAHGIVTPGDMWQRARSWFRRMWHGCCGARGHRGEGTCRG